MGPVPITLREEIDAPERDFTEKIAIDILVTKYQQPMYLVKPKAAFDPAKFTKRELRILDNLANEYKDASAEDMIEATHLETLPWHRVYNIDGNKQGLIPFEYAVKKDEAELMAVIAQENTEIKNNYL